MCGFIGFTFKDKELLKKLGNTQKDRAIDNEYFFFNNNLSFYHAHLSISDLDKNTSQPLVYNDLVIGLVGEIYNKQYLLKISGFNKNEDNFTELEVIGIAYEKLGEKFINYVNGEFAIFIYDKNINKYFCYRDRWGTNNLYYRIYNNQLFFASEIKSLILDKPILNKKAFIEYMTFQFSIFPNTIVNGIYTLEPGTYLKYSNSTLKIFKFNKYEYQENNKTIIQAIENSVKRRITKYQKRIFLSLSGGPDSNLILYFLNKYYRGEIIAYSFRTKVNKEEIKYAIRNTKTLGIKHLIIDMDNYKFNNLEDDIYIHEGLVHLPNLGEILKEKYPEYKDIKVEFGGDGKEELLIGNDHYPYKEIISRYRYFRNKGLIKEYDITQEFLNKTMFDFNLQMIDKITLRNGIERRLPYTDYELLKFYGYKKSIYKPEVNKYLNERGLYIVPVEYGYDKGFYQKKEFFKNLTNLQKEFFKNLIKLC